MINGEIREALLSLGRAMNTRMTRDIGPRVNTLESTMTYRLRHFVRMNPPIILVSKVGEYSKKSFDGVYKVLSSLWVTSMEKAKLVSY